MFSRSICPPNSPDQPDGGELIVASFVDSIRRCHTEEVRTQQEHIIYDEDEDRIRAMLDRSCYDEMMD